MDMKKIIIYSLFLFINVVAFNSCEKTSYDDSKITYYVTFDISGDKTMLVPVGTTFVDPGFKAFEGEKDVTSNVKTDGTVDSNSLGLYTITYSAVNADGYASSTKRIVIVYDPTVTNDIAGNYSIDVPKSNRLQLSNSKIIQYSDMKTLYGKGDFSSFVVTIAKIAPGMFTVSDLFGGYYSDGRGYGSSYEMIGYIALNPDNSLDLLSSQVSAWGDSLDGLENGIYDPATGVIKWSAYYGGAYSFNVVINKK